jgi:hypothetical protein
LAIRQDAAEETADEAKRTALFNEAKKAAAKYPPPEKSHIAAHPGDNSDEYTRQSSTTPSNEATVMTISEERKIYLKVRRSQKTGMMGKAIFVLNARVDLSEEDKSLVSKYALGSLVVYDSKARQQRQATAAAHFDSAVAQSYASAGRSLWSSAKGWANAAIMALSLRVTVGNLMAGQHIECKDLDELLGAESAIIEACRTLKSYLETALTFDGKEELIEI